ncbi:hypothetical protein PTSG_12629 [Salpingoeca rosetta]|uniref:Long-chain-fatty-acid--CoA ligase n=1 Tax=Salpingoeca rosetta (strain ATCC 50818 / BSB-021) TaxID=946362 RepID=F2UHL0_SALR5|nr:uncharacterized protein PTSG_12629 [Salpingoeca rosetta]EGD76609.1 hypothetical protein PTSG_12629 [Salpingoeca rosetta]|eukprot:XP_004991523.1 hypothetical protein PTSG_12629 [Salpingoeca rosetta]
MGAGPSALVEHIGFQVPDSATENSSAVIRNRHFPKELISVPFKDEPEIDTCFKIFARAVEKYGNNDMLGHRTIEADGTAGPYQFESYATVSKQVDRIGAGLAKLGYGEGKTIGIFGINSAAWIKSLLGSWRQGCVCVPLYDTLGAESTKFILKDADVTTVFCAHAKLAQVLDVAQDCGITTIVQFEPVSDDDKAKAPEGLTLMSLDEFMDSGDADAAATPCAKDGLAYIMYTSGTTGNPKGVRLSHGNVTASVAGLIGMGIEILQTDVYLSYLPLAHIFETVMQILGLCSGAAVGFYQGNIRLIMDDIQALRPTVFAGVPRVYSRFYDKVMQTIEASSWVKKTMFNTAFENQLDNVRKGTRNAFWDNLVFNKTKAHLGGRVRLMASGAAPLPAHIMDFLKVVFCCEVHQGYGMTENAAAAVITPGGYTRAGTIGEPVPCCEIKLEDVPELEYTSSDKPFPRGEICIRGHNVFHGYHNLPDKTAETLVDGWLHTGDIGQVLEDGSLQIIDRKKNIFKLAQGEYVAAEELEMVFHRSKYINQIFVYGDSTQSTLVAIVVPDVETVGPWMSEQGIEGDFNVAAKDPKVRDLLLAEIKKEGANAKLAGFKVPKAIFVESDVNELNQGFTIENGCMTPSFKLRRPQLKARYKAEIDKMYSQQ